MRRGQNVIVTSLWPCDPKHLIGQEGYIQSYSPPRYMRRKKMLGVALVSFPALPMQEAWPFTSEQLTIKKR